MSPLALVPYVVVKGAGTGAPGAVVGDPQPYSTYKGEDGPMEVQAVETAPKTPRRIYRFLIMDMTSKRAPAPNKTVLLIPGIRDVDGTETHTPPD